MSRYQVAERVDGLFDLVEGSEIIIKGKSLNCLFLELKNAIGWHGDVTVVSGGLTMTAKISMPQWK